MAGEESKQSAKAARKAASKRVAAKAAKQTETVPKPQPQMARKPVLLSGGNPQIAKGYGNAPVQAYIAAMPGWKRDVGRLLDALVEHTVPDVFKAVKWELALLRNRGTGLVPQLSLLHEVRQSDFLPRHVATPSSPRRVQAQGSALPRHPRGRAVRRSSVRWLGEASQPIARRTTVSGQCASPWRTATPFRPMPM